MGGGKIPRRKAMKDKKGSALMSAKELSPILGISEFTIKKLARSNELPCTYVNRRPLFNMGVLMRHFKKLEGGTA